MREDYGRRSSDAGTGSAQERDSAALRAEIEATRARISRDLDDLGERLNPQHVKQQIKDNVREATIGRVENMARGAADRVNEARRGIMDTVRENPVPAAIAAIGIGWLYINGRKGNQEGDGRLNVRYNPRSGYEPLSAYSPPGSGGYGYEERDSREGHGALERVKEGADAVTENLKEAGESLKEKVGGVAEGAQHAAGRLVDANRRQARRAEDLFYDNPLAIGAATVALGMVVGLSAPRTHTEAKLVGGVRDDVVDRLSETARETVDKAQHTVERVMEETKASQPRG